MSVTVEDLENFISINETDLDKIKESLNEFNIFNVLGVQRREIRHSNFLGWLFDPNGSHKLEAVFLKDLLKLVSDAGSLDSDKLNNLCNEDLSDTIVYRESLNNIDILLVNKTKDFIICIENKIDHHYDVDQLKKYYKFVENNFGNVEHRCYITLTPFKTFHHKANVCGEYYNNISYIQIAQILRKNTKHIDTARITVKESINQYCTMVEKDITQTSKEVLLAKEIYRKHKKEIDFIMSNQENFAFYKEDILNFIKNGNIEGIDLSHHIDNKNVIYLLPTNEKLRDLFYFPNVKSRGGDFIFCLVLYLVKDAVWLKFGFGNIENPEKYPEIRFRKEEQFKAMKKFECFKNYKREFDTHHNSSATDDYPSIGGVTLFNDDLYFESRNDIKTLLKERFEELNKELIRPWAQECIEKLSN